MVYTLERGSLAIQEHHGESILGRFASEDFGGERQGVREPAGVGGTVLRELCLGTEDFLAEAAVFREENRTIIVSRLTVVEINSIFSRRVRTGDLTVADATSLRNHFLNDVATGAFKVVAITDQHYSEAERLVIQYANTKSLRLGSAGIGVRPFSVKEYSALRAGIFKA